MEKNFNNSETVQYLLLDNNDTVLAEIESQLRHKLETKLDGATELEILPLFLICLLKRNIIETKTLSEHFAKYIKLVKKTDKHLRKEYREHKSTTKKMQYNVFLNLTAHRLYYIESLYRRINVEVRGDIAKITRKNIELRQSLIEGKISTFLNLLFQKTFSNYGTSFLNLSIATLVLIGIFGGIFYANDLFFAKNLFIWYDGIQPLDYYLYISTTTLSNLGADAQLAYNLPLRIIFAIEQLVGIVLMGLTVTILSKKI